MEDTDMFLLYLRGVIQEHFADRVKEFIKNPKKRLKIDFNNIDIDKSFLHSFLNNKESDLESSFKTILREYIPTLDPDFSLSNIDVLTLSFSGLYSPEVVKLSELDHTYLNKLVAVEGIIFQYSQPKDTIKRAGWRCSSCGETTYWAHHKLHLDKPELCEFCGKHKFNNEPVADSIEYHTTQRLLIQEPIEELANDKRPDILDIFICGGNTQEFFIGLNNIFIGYLRQKKLDLSKSQQERYLECIDIVPGKTIFERLKITDDDLFEIEQFSKTPNLITEFSKIIVPKIVGLDHIKQGLVLQMFGGVERKDLLNNGKRGAIHIYMCGNPGTGKTELMKGMQKFYPRTQSVTGGDTTRVGLTASITKSDIKDNTDPVLSPGSIILADKGLLIIDEFDKMHKDDQASLHNAMEHGEVSIHKWNIHKNYSVTTTVLASGNPMFNSFKRGKDIKESGLSYSMISRFDLVYLLDSSLLSTNEEQIHNSMFYHNNNIYNDASKGLNLDFYLKYINYSKTFNPTIPKYLLDDVKKESMRIFKKIREGSEELSHDFNARVANSIQRLAEASARMHLSNEITMRDIFIAKNILIEAYKTINVNVDDVVDLNVYYHGKSSDYFRLVELVKELIESVDIMDFRDILKNIKTTEEELYEAIRDLESKGIIYEIEPKKYKIKSF